MTTDDVIEFARGLGHLVSRQGHAHLIRLDAAPYVVEVVVPDSVFEWFVTVRDPAGTEVFSDWCEHLVGTRDERARERSSSVNALISALHPGRLRLIERKSLLQPARLEVQVGNSWCDIWDLDSSTPGG